MKRIEQMSLWERAYVPEIVRGLSVTGYHFWRNLSIHILHAFGLAKSSQADVTVQYPEERAPYPDTFRGRHRLTLGADDTANCTACFLCATACPADCIYIEAGEDPRNPVRSTRCAMKSIHCAASIAVFVSKPVLATRFAWTPELIPAI
jgi:formate hydrogenlyase subunit 6/NADH:ubiquinone oxidoreductase subunit I